MPVRMAFEKKKSIETWVVVVDTLVDCLYLFDCLLTFFVPLISDDGKHK